jgi:hypothetical protein
VVTPDSRTRLRSAVGPPSAVQDVVGVAPRGRPVATGKAAVTVHHHHCPPERCRDHRVSPAHVERLGRSLRDHAGDGCVAGPPPDDLGVHGAGVCELRGGPDTAFQRLEGHDHGDVWPFPAHRWAGRLVQPLPAHLFQRVGPALGRGPWSSSAGWRHSPSMAARRAASTVCPVSGSRSPSTRTIPPRVGETNRRRTWNAKLRVAQRPGAVDSLPPVPHGSAQDPAPRAPVLPPRGCPRSRRTPPDRPPARPPERSPRPARPRRRRTPPWWPASPPVRLPPGPGESPTPIPAAGERPATPRLRTTRRDARTPGGGSRPAVGPARRAALRRPVPAPGSRPPGPRPPRGRGPPPAVRRAPNEVCSRDPLYRTRVRRAQPRGHPRGMRGGGEEKQTHAQVRVRQPVRVRSG